MILWGFFTIVSPTVSSSAVLFGIRGTRDSLISQFWSVQRSIYIYIFSDLLTRRSLMIKFSSSWRKRPAIYSLECRPFPHHHIVMLDNRHGLVVDVSGIRHAPDERNPLQPWEPSPWAYLRDSKDYPRRRAYPPWKAEVHLPGKPRRQAVSESIDLSRPGVINHNRKTSPEKTHLGYLRWLICELFGI